MIIKANYIDIENRNIYAAAITIDGSKIVTVQAIDEELEDYILPGFIDAHIHIESSMVLPSEFAKVAVLHGRVYPTNLPFFLCIQNPLLKLQLRYLFAFLFP